MASAWRIGAMGHKFDTSDLEVKWGENGERIVHKEQGEPAQHYTSYSQLFKPVQKDTIINGTKSC